MPEPVEEPEEELPQGEQAVVGEAPVQHGSAQQHLGPEVLLQQPEDEDGERGPEDVVERQVEGVVQGVDGEVVEELEEKLTT